MENKTTTIEKVNTTGIRYRTPDGLIFMSKEEFLDYMEGLN